MLKLADPRRREAEVMADDETDMMKISQLPRRRGRREQPTAADDAENGDNSEGGSAADAKPGPS